VHLFCGVWVVPHGVLFLVCFLWVGGVWCGGLLSECGNDVLLSWIVVDENFFLPVVVGWWRAVGCLRHHMCLCVVWAWFPVFPFLWGWWGVWVCCLRFV
jgi:hypothetical protein